MPTMLEQIRSAQRGESPPAPIAQLIGFTAEPRHANPMGTLRGGVLCDIADAAMGMAWAAMLGEGETFTTLELKINFLRPVWAGRLTATGRVVNGGRTIGLLAQSGRPGRIEVMKPGLAALLVAGLLAGCASTGSGGWTKPGASEQQIGRDTTECLSQAQIIQGGPQGPRTSIEQDRYRRCMIERGYSTGPGK